MPELPEVEAARALIEATALGRTIESVDAPDAWYLKRGLTASALDAALPSRRFTTARRRGKLLMLDTDGDGPVLGLHLGMSGRILVDGSAAGDPLIYASNEDLPHWRRFGVRFTGDGSLYVRDPRRLGAVELDPDEERLGPDARALAQPDLDRVVTRSRAPLKAVLMDQSRVAGLGNLLTDEALWRAGLDPARPANSLDRNERRRLHRSIHRTLTLTIERGGAHTGDHIDQRFPGGVCPKDGTPFVRRTVGGRTTYSCPEHQR